MFISDPMGNQYDVNQWPHVIFPDDNTRGGGGGLWKFLYVDVPTQGANLTFKFCCYLLYNTCRSTYLFLSQFLYGT